jgi:predicted ATPase
VAGAGHVNLTWKQSNYKRPLYANQLSDGQLRILWLLAVIHSAQDDGLILLDEPELSLHPQWILLLISMLRQLSARTNVLVATQSAEFVRWLERDELLIADIDEEGTTFSWADQKVDLDKWLKDFTLSELWTMGELGGRR